MKYAAIGSFFLNEINFADGKKISGIIGGGGFFAYCGLLQYTPDCLFVAGAGNDFEAHFGDFFRKNAIRTDGLIPYADRNTVATMYYEPDGRWHETFAFGPDRHKDMSWNVCLLDFFLQYLEKTGERPAGAYVAIGITEADAWERVKTLREKYGVKIMLELYTSDCAAENYPLFCERVLPNVDYFSLNRPESFALFSEQSEEAVIERLKTFSAPCFYRVGTKGSYTVKGNEVGFAPSVHICAPEQEIDPTGCGNNSTGAALWGLCEGYSALEVSYIGNVSAAYNVMQYGPYPRFDAQTRQEALRLALQYAKQ